MSKVYYNGKLYPKKDWDFEKRRPKTKANAVKVVEEVKVETELEKPLEADLEA
jgi:hypothetical protein